MTATEKIKFYKSLCALPCPVAHTLFAEPQEPPFIVYVDDSITKIAANSTHVGETEEIRLELYTVQDGTAEAEEIVEEFLEEFTTYSKARSYIDSERLYVTYYTFRQ